MRPTATVQTEYRGLFVNVSAFLLAVKLLPLIQTIWHTLMTTSLTWLPTGVAWRSKVDVFSGVCLFVGLFVRMITFERLNVG